MNSAGPVLCLPARRRGLAGVRLLLSSHCGCRCKHQNTQEAGRLAACRTRSCAGRRQRRQQGRLAGALLSAAFEIGLHPYL